MPYVNPFREDRLHRIRELSKMLEEAKEADLDKLIGLLGLKWGSTEESIMKMLKQLEKAGMIEIDNELHKVKYKIKAGEEG
jgi:Mn-dependent DtxR family transcriptional regulator